MYSSRSRDHKSDKTKRSRKDKRFSKLINNSDTEGEGESEHELSHYIKDRVKLMKEVLKIIKPKKIKIMAPACIKELEIEEINSMLLEELLGISNKRLEYIFEGKSLEEDSSSSDEDQPVDMISLDDISDDDFVIISDDEIDKQSKKHKRKKIKEEPREKSKKIKKEKPEKERGKAKEKNKEKDKSKEKGKTSGKDKEPVGEENLMSVLELLELQARARAIKSQLALESSKKQEQVKAEQEQTEINGQDDDVIIEIPKEEEIVITSSESENDDEKKLERVKSSKNQKMKEHREETTRQEKASENLLNNVNENTSESVAEFSLQSKDDVLKTNGKDGESEQAEKEKYSEENCEDGEVSDNEEAGKNSGMAIPLMEPNKNKKSTVEGNSAASKNVKGSNSENITFQGENSDGVESSTSSESDNLHVVMLREKRRQAKGFIKTDSKNEKQNAVMKSVKVCVEEKKEENINKGEGDSANIEVTDKLYNEDVHKESVPETEGSEISQSNKIEAAITDFLKTHPTPENIENPEGKEYLKVRRIEEKLKESKEKRLRHLKNKLLSYKKDFGVESSINILENIVIKPQCVVDGGSGTIQVDSDDLVINVDQDDLDCIICD